MTKDDVLLKLRSAGTFVSGQTLSGELGVSRTAVWKAIAGLKNEGYVIEAVTNRGYRLVPEQGTDVLNEVELKAALRACGSELVTPDRLVFFRETGSTNEDIQNLALEGAPEGTMAAAAAQTRGRGRRGRTWVSPEGGNVYMSILLRPVMEPEKAPMMTPIMAMAVRNAMAHALQKAGDTQDRVMIKWPNDVVIGRTSEQESWKKACGILTEMRLEERDIKDVVIGAGLNLNMKEFPEVLQNSATSLCIVLGGKTVDRAETAALTAAEFGRYYRRFLADGDLSGLREEYEDMLVNMGRTVRVLDPKGEFSGTAVGINREGALLVKLEDGSTVSVNAGEVSVRGVEGYV